MDFISDKLYVERYDELGALYQYIRPPVQYSNMDRLGAVLKASNIDVYGNSNTTVNNILPRLSTFLVGMTYDSRRKFNPQHSIQGTLDTETNQLSKIMAPVPYMLEIEVAVLAKSIDDNMQIIEQLAPYFAPSYNMELSILPDYEPEIIPFSISSIVPDGNDEYAMIDNRIFTSMITFSAPINYYYIPKTSKVIREIIMNFHSINGEDYKKFKSYQMTEQSIAPTVEMTVEEMDIATTITEF